jgi:hypothetical protein
MSTNCMRYTSISFYMSIKSYPKQAEISKLIHIVTLYSKDTRTLTFKNRLPPTASVICLFAVVPGDVWGGARARAAR